MPRSQSEPIVELSVVPSASGTVIAQLESMLELARRGRITGLAAATYSPRDGVNLYGSGALTDRPELAVGAVTQLLRRFLRE